jgi:hypothetical protein
MRKNGRVRVCVRVKEHVRVRDSARVREGGSERKREREIVIVTRNKRMREGVRARVVTRV